MWAMHLRSPTLCWGQCNTFGTPPMHHIHSSSAVVGAIWVIHGGRRPGKFNTTNATYSYNLDTARRVPVIAGQVWSLHVHDFLLWYTLKQVQVQWLHWCGGNAGGTL